MTTNKLQRYYRKNLMTGMSKEDAMRAAQKLVEQDAAQIPANRKLVEASLAYSETMKRQVCIPAK